MLLRVFLATSAGWDGSCLVALDGYECVSWVDGRGNFCYIGEIERGHMKSGFLEHWEFLSCWLKQPKVFEPRLFSSFCSLFFLRKSNCLGFSSSFPLPLLVLSQSFFYACLLWFAMIGWKGFIRCISLSRSSWRPFFLATPSRSIDSRLFRFSSENSVEVLSSSEVADRVGDLGKKNWLAYELLSLEGKPVRRNGALSQLFRFWDGSS